jgi:MraZ protein
VGVLLNAAFVGMSSGLLDKKGRVCIPSSYRQALSAQQNPFVVYLRHALLTPSLEGFGAQVVQRFLDAQTESDPFFTAAHDTDAFAALALSQELAIDETGRVRLPDDFIAYAGLKDGVTFVGLGVKFEIWDSAQFAKVREERMEAAREQARSREQGRKP